jgi:hypothetical protein
VKKAHRIAALVTSLNLDQSTLFDPCYLAYFEHFNARDYYEAHDVLEQLWLKCDPETHDYAFYKGLIQLAGSFVHLKLQHAQPDHPNHGRRLAPARRLFLRAAENLIPYAPRHHGLNLAPPITLATSFAELLAQGGDSLNPWNPDQAPQLPLPSEGPGGV